jgi:hypothetical protein
VWKSTVDGRRLTFRLAGINNQNFIMRDEETGTWWQQVSGCALHGPLAGRCLTPILWDEVTFAVFRADHPGGEVLRPDEATRADYDTARWEEEIAELPTVTPVSDADRLEPRDLIVGIAEGGAAIAFPAEEIGGRTLLLGRVGGTPVAVVLHPDGRSLRCFDRRVGDETLDLYLAPGSNPPVILDAKSGSLWDFSGAAVSGPLAGERMRRINCLKDYWFDWKTYHPKSEIYDPDRLD